MGSRATGRGAVAAATTVSTDNISLSGLGGGVSLVGSLLGSGQISQRSLLFLGQVLGVLLSLVSHLALGGLNSLDGLKSRSGSGGMGTSSLGGRGKSLSLLKSLDLGGLNGLSGLRNLGRQRGFGLSSGLGSLNLRKQIFLLN